ncbi:hypothetical protein BDA96_10G331200 [Sorghum bicolor]|jgi:hypothetical protein|uniref:F-box domain-containing protein n=2 Tax=Sorghum bicolor TaxID=4558 RepID=A0A921Q895_SORBI|nr:uncharacterized protein LOC8065594 [Sorghum bicolor]EER88925.1 hypothetical protein SORBI_3010G256500 [Sorghum bicolor]KAG0516067.1 hypothetical protein BDA96_10G331200 [Sorghum bicolor]|eukprot:XP_002437558.1 uncharacterized protein LOC8065594 [Sorghum bicolor]
MSMSKLAVGVAGGWADLPRDLLESVLARLPVPDRVRFPAVCTAWQSAHTAAGIQHAALSPWLMLPFNPTARVDSVDDNDGSCAKLTVVRFLSLAEDRAYAIRQPAPAARERLCVGSSPDGWLVTADACSELSLLNPVTGAQLRLPPAATLPFVDARRGADGRVESYGLRFSFFDGGCGEEETLVPPETLAPDRLRFEVYEKAVVVSAPRRCGTSASSWGGYAVLLICQPLGRLAVARAGDAEWALLDADAPGRCWVDAVRASSSSARRDHQPVYTMDAAGRVDAWDTDAATAPRAVAPSCVCTARACAMSAACRKYLVELSPGCLLQVHRLREAAHARYAWEPRPEHVEYTTTGAELFEWTAAAGRWARADGRVVLGGRALFLGKSVSLCVPADDAGVRSDCVYFTDDGPWSHNRCHEVAPDVGVLDLTDGSYRPPRGAARDLLWKWPPPVWVFPSLAD